MALTVPQLFSSILLLPLLFPLLCQANLPDTKGEKPSSPFQFLKLLNGSKKGDKVKGLQQIKKYLEHFGYLSYDPHLPYQNHANDDKFDNLLESAIKLYQLNFHLNVTGTLDSNTVSTMMTPRCGMPDIINGTNLMQLGSYYSFFPGELKWPPSKYHLTFAFKSGTRNDAFHSIRQAFSKWAQVSRFTFSQVEDVWNADLKISFESYNHGDGNNFDGPGGILAHSYAPTDGRLHFDASERWAAGRAPGAFDIGTVGLHEIGHLLGLGHSNVGAAIMWPSVGAETIKGLNEDDIQGLKALYHF
ncbi:neutrophil collagenase [Sarracenia purpurea var. burkii]